MVSTTYEIGYGQLTKAHIEKFSKMEKWNDIVSICECPPEIDERIQSVVNVLLQDNEFKASWEKLRTFYGNTPSIKLCDDATTCVNEKYIAFPASTSEESLTIKILRPPVITCSAQLFPAIASLNLIQHVFTLHALNVQESKSSEYASAVGKIIFWAKRNASSRGLLELNEASERDITINQQLFPKITLVASYKAGNRSLNKLDVELEVGALAALSS